MWRPVCITLWLVCYYYEDDLERAISGLGEDVQELWQWYGGLWQWRRGWFLFWCQWFLLSFVWVCDLVHVYYAMSLYSLSSRRRSLAVVPYQGEGHPQLHPFVASLVVRWRRWWEGGGTVGRWWGEGGEGRTWTQSSRCQAQTCRLTPAFPQPDPWRSCPCRRSCFPPSTGRRGGSPGWPPPAGPASWRPNTSPSTSRSLTGWSTCTMSRWSRNGRDHIGRVTRSSITMPSRCGRRNVLPSWTSRTGSLTVTSSCSVGDISQWSLPEVWPEMIYWLLTLGMSTQLNKLTTTTPPNYQKQSALILLWWTGIVWCDTDMLTKSGQQTNGLWSGAYDEEKNWGIQISVAACLISIQLSHTNVNKDIIPD